jgi:hypothetical protein
LSETVSWNDAIFVSLGARVVAPDHWSLSESLSSRWAGLLPLIEDVPLSDSWTVGRTLKVSLSDPVPISEALGYMMRLDPELPEAIRLSESLSIGEDPVVIAYNQTVFALKLFDGPIQIDLSKLGSVERLKTKFQDNGYNVYDTSMQVVVGGKPTTQRVFVVWKGTIRRYPLLR